MAVNKTIAALIVTALLCGAGYWHFIHEDSEQVQQNAISSLEDEKEPDVVAALEPVPRGVSSTRSAASSTIFQHYQCPSGTADCERNPHVAATPEEALWMVEHGYPTVKQIEDIRTRSTADYQEEYERTGSKVAQSLYGISLAMNGDARMAIGLLSDGAAHGNIYAFYVLSEIYRRTEELANLTTSAAYLRAAYLAGDYRAADRYAYQFGILSPPENLVADKEAFQLFKTFGRGRNSPRP
jgi:hypothetical protein